MCVCVCVCVCVKCVYVRAHVCVCVCARARAINNRIYFGINLRNISNKDLLQVKIFLRPVLKTLNERSSVRERKGENFKFVRWEKQHNKQQQRQKPPYKAAFF